MNLYIKKKIADEIGLQHFKPFGFKEETWSHRDYGSLNLFSQGEKVISRLQKLLKQHEHVHGVKVLLSDIDVFFRARQGSTKIKPRTCEQFAQLLTLYFLDVPGHRIYARHGEDQWLAYYVDDIEYHHEVKHQYSTTPEHVTIDTIYEEFGGRKHRRWTFWASECVGMPILESLARKHLQPEIKTLRDIYLKQLKVYSKMTSQVGMQVYASGTGTTDLDGNPSPRDGWYFHSTKTIQMERPLPTRCVIDVFYEDPSTERKDNKVSPDVWFWPGKVRELKHKDDSGDFHLSEERVEPEIPIHPMVAVFDLSKHLRLRVHVDHLKEYVYDTKLADKLIIPKDHKQLIHMLVEHKDSDFSDIIKGKSGGAVVLLCGKPGVGKTLTAEVYAESEQRALYSVQCSQLGIDPDNIEDELLKVFARARRWNAITLLDEADVYVRSRGESLRHNAVVGVFLRVLEYQSSVLFLTTNRADDIDDAIASRCVARIEYGSPSKKDQKAIWEMLASHNESKLSPKAIDAIINTCGDNSGRDIKNLLKLAMLLKPGEPITAESISYVKRFKPTKG